MERSAVRTDGELRKRGLNPKAYKTTRKAEALKADLKQDSGPATTHEESKSNLARSLADPERHTITAKLQILGKGSNGKIRETLIHTWVLPEDHQPTQELNVMCHIRTTALESAKQLCPAQAVRRVI